MISANCLTYSKKKKNATTTERAFNWVLSTNLVRRNIWKVRRWERSWENAQATIYEVNKHAWQQWQAANGKINVTPRAGWESKCAQRQLSLLESWKIVEKYLLHSLAQAIREWQACQVHKYKAANTHKYIACVQWVHLTAAGIFTQEIMAKCRTNLVTFRQISTLNSN